MNKVNFKSHGFTFLELIATITIISIALAGTTALINPACNIINQAIALTSMSNNPRVALNLLTQDLLQNTGNLSLQNDNTTTTFSFQISNDTVAYICDYNTNTMYRKLNQNIPEILLEQINDCNFTSSLSKKNINLTLFANINFTNNSNFLYEVINAPNYE